MRAGSQTDSIPMASQTARCHLGIRPGGDEEGDVAGPAGGQEPVGAAGRVGPDHDGSRGQLGSSPHPVAGRRLTRGSWAMAASRTVTWSATVLAPALPGRRKPDSTSPVASAKQNIGWKPEPALVGGGGLLLAVGVDLDQRGVDVEDHRALPGGGRRPGPDLGPHLGHGLGDRLHGSYWSIWWKVRNTVESEGTDPNRAGWSRRCSMSAQLSPPPASIRARLDEDLPPVVERKPLTGRRDAGRERITEPQTVGKTPKGVQSDVGHDARPAGFHLHARHALVPFTLEVPSCCWDLVASRTTVSLVRRAFPRTWAVQVRRPRE